MSPAEKAPEEQIIKVDYGRDKRNLVGVGEKIHLVVWFLVLAATQLWNDLLAWRYTLWTMPMSDMITRLFFLPVGRATPRLVTGGPYERLSVFDIDPRESTRYEESAKVFDLKTKQIINCASNNYAGFSRLEGKVEELIEHTIKHLPFAPGPPELEDAVKAEVRQYMGFEGCEFMPSGFSSNLLAFRTVYQHASSQNRPCIFLCDRDLHNSLLTGAFTNSKRNAATYKFKHNDLTDLELKLQALKQQLPNAYICVVVEGIYSLEGVSAPLPAMLALKKVYKFSLFVDEAHSFLSMGSGGRGSFEHWQDLGYDCPLTDCEIMTCMFSKSAGCTGGTVLARGDLAPLLDQQGREAYERGHEQLSTAVLVRLLDILRKPELIAHRCRTIKKKGLYAASVLDKAGFRVLSFPGSPVICFSVGSLRQLAKFQRAVHQRGIAVAVAGVPATTLWTTRVRMSIFATQKWTDLQHALSILIDTGVAHHITGVKKIDPMTEKPPIDESSAQIEQAYISVDEDLIKLVDSLASRYPLSTNVGSSNEVIQASCAAVKRYGIGPCSARWFYGSFDSYLALEQRLAQMYPALTKHVGQCRAMVCGDADVTIGSSFAARCGISSYRTSTNFILVPRSGPHFVHESIQPLKMSKTRRLIYYDSVADIPQLLAREVTENKSQRTKATIYLETATEQGCVLDLVPLLTALSQSPAKQLTNVCLFLDDRNGLNKIGPRRLGYLDYLENMHGSNVFAKYLGANASSVDVVLAGSWYNSFGHQGGYVVGASVVVESLTWNARAYFFSTPPMPLQTVMSNKALAILQGENETQEKVLSN